MIRLNSVLVVLFVLVAVTAGSPVEGQNGGSYLSQVNHSPKTPTVGQPVNFSVVVKNANKINLTNVTLSISSVSIPQEVVSHQMVFDSGGRYHYEMVFDETMTFTYIMQLFADQALLESSEPVMVEVVTSGNSSHSHFGYNYNGSLGKGNHVVSSEDGQFNLSLSLNAPVKINLTRTYRQELKIQADFAPVTDGFEIDVNDTNAVSSSYLSLAYDPDQLLSSRINPNALVFAFQEVPDGVWHRFNASVDDIMHTVSAILPHFSTWTLAATSPQLRFMAPDVVVEAEVDTYVKITTILKNFGATTAEAVTIRMVGTPSVLLNNHTLFEIDSIESLEEVIATWDVFFTETGNYSLIFLAEAEDTLGDLLQVMVNVGGNNPTVSSNSSLSVHYPFTIVIILVSISVARKRV